VCAAGSWKVAKAFGWKMRRLPGRNIFARTMQLSPGIEGKDCMKRLIGYTTPQALTLYLASSAIALLASLLASVPGFNVVLS